jgi:hypothetical protein
MRIADRIANKILEEIEESANEIFKENSDGDLVLTQEKYLEAECMVADTIQLEILRWLGYDTDLQTFEGE